MFEIDAPDFSLESSLASGQSFRWSRDGGWMYGFLGEAAIKLRQQDGRLLCESSDSRVTPANLAHYFALDVPYAAILSSINVDVQLQQAIARYWGLRVLRQDAWETLASFICSSFNNIRRIEGIIDRLCQAYGRPVGFNGFRGFSFPSPQTLAAASERQLRSLGLGYRAPYLKQTARLVADGKLPLAHLKRLDYPSVKQALLACDGVGDKVADCVALFGFEKYEAFPVDVWMERAMRTYFRHRKMTRKRIHDYARRRFGAYAGYAQQFLYHYVRNLRCDARKQPTFS